MNEKFPLLVTRVGAVGIIELARPEKYNCLSVSVFSAMETAIDAFEQAGSGVRAILVRAEGKHFCTGADLDEVMSLRKDADMVRDFISHAHRVLMRLEASDLPVVAACQGLSLAGGIELMLACDVVFAAKDSRFGDQHAQFGLIPGFGGSQRLPRIVGLRRSLDLFFSGRWIDADTALQWGLVNYVVESDVLGRLALDYCDSLAARSRVGIASMKRFARLGLEDSLQSGLKLEEALASASLLEDDVTEGLAAFKERRAPRFKS